LEIPAETKHHKVWAISSDLELGTMSGLNFQAHTALLVSGSNPAWNTHGTNDLLGCKPMMSLSGTPLKNFKRTRLEGGKETRMDFQVRGCFTKEARVRLWRRRRYLDETEPRNVNRYGEKSVKREIKW
jgi:hypothetical protein